MQVAGRRLLQNLTFIVCATVLPVGSAHRPWHLPHTLPVPSPEPGRRTSSHRRQCAAPWFPRVLVVLTRMVLCRAWIVSLRGCGHTEKKGPAESRP